MDVSSIRVSFSVTCRVNEDGNPSDVVNQTAARYHCEEHGGTSWGEWSSLKDHLQKIHGQTFNGVPSGPADILGAHDHVSVGLEPPSNGGDS